MSTTIALTPLRLQHGHERVGGLDLVGELQARDAGLGDDGRGVLQRHADEADLRRRRTFLIVYGGRIVLPVPVVDHVGREVLEVGARERVGRRRSSGCSCRRRRRGSRRSASAAAPCSPRRTRGCPRRSTSRPSLFIASMVGSSWKAADSSGRGADEVAGGDGHACCGGRLAGLAQVRREVLDAAGVGVDVGRPCPWPGRARGRSRRRPLEPVGGSRFPWKSLNDRIWTSRVLSRGWALEIPLVVATPVPAARTTARTPVRRRVRAVLMGLPCSWSTRGIGRFARAGAGYGLSRRQGEGPGPTRFAAVTRTHPGHDHPRP